MTVTVNPNVTPTFPAIGPYCQFSTPPALPGTSNNGIIGTWAPNTVFTGLASTDTYTFIPNAGQCATVAPVMIQIQAAVTPTFTQVAPICSGGSFTLPTTSNNGIAGSWSPAINNMMTMTYSFTPNAALHPCAATTTTMTVVVNPNVTPTFTQVAPICSGGYFYTSDHFQQRHLRLMAARHQQHNHNHLQLHANPWPMRQHCADDRHGEPECDAYLHAGSAYMLRRLVLVTACFQRGYHRRLDAGHQQHNHNHLQLHAHPGQCATTQTMTVTVNPNPTANVPVPFEVCVLIIPPTLLSENSATVLSQITGGNPGLTVNWFFDAAATMPIPNINNIFLAFPPPTTVYATVSNGSCSSSTVPVGIIINLPPVINAPGNVSACQSYTLPPITGANLTGSEAYYTGPNGTGTQFLPGQVISSTITLFAYAGSGICSDQEQFTITITPPPTATAPGAPLSICDNGAGIGQFNLTNLNGIISGGSGTVNWFTDAGATIPIANPSAFVSGATTVYATVTVGICSSSPVPLVLQLTPGPAANPAGPLEACDNGAGLGLFLLSNLNNLISGGSGTVSWFSDAGTSISIPNPNAHVSGGGTVYAVVSLNGCISVPVPINLILNALPMANQPPTPFELCAVSGNSAVFNLNNLNSLISGGSGTVNWFSNPAGTISIPNPGAYSSSSGTVYASVTNGNCTSQAVPVSLQVNPLPVVNLTVAQAISCATSANGAISTSISGATGPFTFDWNNNLLDGQQNPANLGPGTYAVTITVGATGCSGTGSITLTAPTAITLNCAQQNPVSVSGGSDGSATVQISGGTAAYTVAWSGAASGSQNQATAGTATITGLIAGTYNILVTDANGCTQTCSFTIGSPNCNLTATAVGSNPDCNGAATGSIALTVTGGTGTLTFDWNNNTLDGIEDPTGLSAGTYSVTATDGAGCTANASVTLTDPAALVLVCAQQNPVSTLGGSDGSATIQITGGTPGYAIAWSGAASGSQMQIASGTATITGLVAGNYVVAVSDANGCLQNCSFTISSPNCNLSATAAGTNPDCNGAATGSIALSVTGGTGTLTFDWNNNTLDGIEDPAGLSAGTYSVTVTDGAGCTANASVTLTDPAALVLVCAQQNPVSTIGGSDGSATVQISGGTAAYTVAWSGAASGSQNQATVGTATITGLIAGTYNIVVTDANGCTQTCSFTIGSPNCNLSATAVGTNPDCNGAATGSIALTVTGGTGSLTFDWNYNILDGTEDPTGLLAGLTFYLSVIRTVAAILFW
jgi:hypothetical protein